MNTFKMLTLWLVLGSIAWLFCPSAIAQIIPQTGQTKCFDEEGLEIDCASTGQDGEFLAGASWPDPRFIDNNDGTISDSLTGLMWLADGACLGDKTWIEALAIAESFNTNPVPFNCQNYTANYSDWHLPNINELMSLYSPMMFEENHWLIDAGFLTLAIGSYWSSTTMVESVKTAWLGNMDDGYLNNTGKGFHNDTWLVRIENEPDTKPIRTGQTLCYSDTGNIIDCAGTGQDGEFQYGTAWPDPRFTDNNDQTVLDNLTKLVWLKDANCLFTNYPEVDTDGLVEGKVFFQTAIDFINGMNDGTYPLCAGGKDDWRMPNSYELRSLIDHGNVPSLAPGNPFINHMEFYYWTNSNWYIDKTQVWVVGVYYGDVYTTWKDDKAFFWPVRDDIPDEIDGDTDGDDDIEESDGDDEAEVDTDADEDDETTPDGDLEQDIDEESATDGDEDVETADGDADDEDGNGSDCVMIGDTLSGLPIWLMWILLACRRYKRKSSEVIK